MAKKKCQVAYKPPKVETEIKTSDEELLEVTKLIEEEEEAKKKAKDDEVAMVRDRATMVGEYTMAARPPPRHTGARPKMPTHAPSSQAMANKPTSFEVGNDSSDEEILKAALDLEHLKLRAATSETQEGGAQHGAHRHGDHHGAPLQEEGGEGDWQVLDRTPSPG